MVRLQIVGGGRMGEALLAGLLGAGWAEASELAVVERLDARRRDLAEGFPGVAVLERPTACEGAVLAVKPTDAAETAQEIALAGARRVLSIAAGVTTGALEAALGAGIAVVRAMPNTPAVVGAGASAIAGGISAGDDDLDWAASVLDAVGVVVRVSEGQLDAVTGLSGSGPAYVFLVAESLIEAGVLVGLSREVAEVLAVQTLLGSGRLLESSDEHAAALRAGVTSPGGTTAAGLHALESGGLRAAILDAVKAATERSRELGR
ncbi:pyrroline-5-carboxylate reductase [Rhabdothermincola salaria]|uniref:pyrroline-5-carboxylate reductase n=1 Tax=Rhabdothermincola salaria TaxID=2903142 RepID=UPI001E2B6703|nr:pyrroline-5-carboxylate reductase [Rhabdothermincola salaria]MCD9625359.1 pyrroline-5-carboxylate reductase [Rhabdothermincola salaria]